MTAGPPFLNSPRRLNVKTTTLAAVAPLLFGTTAFAGPISYSAILGHFENPTTRSPGIGAALGKGGFVLNTMQTNATFSGFTSGAPPAALPFFRSPGWHARF